MGEQGTTLKFSLGGLAAGAGTLLTWLFGEWTMPLVVLVAFVAMDYVSGVLSAYARGVASSRVGLRGIARKVATLMLVVVAHLADRLVGTPDPFLRTMAIWLLVANEGVSILENLQELGVPIPEQITEAIRRLHDRATPPSVPKPPAATGV